MVEPMDKGVSIPENPDEKSVTEGVIFTNKKTLGEWVGHSAGLAMQQAVELSGKIGNEYAMRLADQRERADQRKDDDQEARRNTFATSMKFQSAHGKNVNEIDPVEARSIQETFLDALADKVAARILSLNIPVQAVATPADGESETK
jgi:hypothetical protein